MEAWFRLDPLDMRPNGFISQVFALYDSKLGSYKLGFGISNTFLRVYLGATIEDIHFNFSSTAEYWHYVAVSYAREHEHETYMWAYIDKNLVRNTSIFDWYEYKYNYNNYYL